MSEYVTIVVLNDGDTFTDADGCSLAVVRKDQYEQVIGNGGRASDLTPVVEIGLINFTTER